MSDARGEHWRIEQLVQRCMVKSTGITAVDAAVEHDLAAALERLRRYQQVQIIAPKAGFARAARPTKIGPDPTGSGIEPQLIAKAHQRATRLEVECALGIRPIAKIMARQQSERGALGDFEDRSGAAVLHLRCIGKKPY
ncbi:hypothetical protein [Sphingomonas sp. 10B4]|uniref:hypothetical protein n=1 Tax=Sphingomonas sp. 10B4 TaxID=3048575 RepID=UPI002AB49C5B|nr:hypothetical protein [Sphingomonas sp. 10B4]MDY7524268.1 hypothetical protein [Sphingomonas sp. 10B4]MEB0282266.1 hypothetical protein [Sphingomonas sp. 10B4]